MKTKILGMFEDTILYAPAGEGAAAGGGDNSSSGPASGEQGRPAGEADNIYGGGDEGESAPTPKGKGKNKQAPAEEGGEEGGGEGEGDEKDEGEDFGDKSGKGADEGAEGGEGDEGEGTGEGTGEGEGEGEGEVKPTVLKLDAETIAALRGQRGEQRQERQEVQLTDQQRAEQARKMFNPVEVTPEVLQSLGFENPTPEQVKGFQGFANSVVKNAVSIAKVMIQRKEEEFQQMMGPLTEHYEKAQVAQTRSEFYGTFKHLEKYDKIVKAAAAEVNPKNADGSSKSKIQVFKEVAASTVATLKSLGVVVQTPNANHGAAGNNQQRQVPNPNRSGAPAGRSGGDNRQGGKPNNPDADIYAR